jgi:hypothetical protein
MSNEPPSSTVGPPAGLANMLLPELDRILENLNAIKEEQDTLLAEVSLFVQCVLYEAIVEFKHCTSYSIFCHRRREGGNLS